MVLDSYRNSFPVFLSLFILTITLCFAFTAMNKRHGDIKTTLFQSEISKRENVTFVCRGKSLKSFRLSHQSKKILNKPFDEISSVLEEQFCDSGNENQKRCQCRFMKQRNVVECLDNYQKRRHIELAKFFNTTVATMSARPLHIAFFGDSRIRQQYFTLVQTIPDNDYFVSSLKPELHEDRYVYSKLLNLVVSYWWRPSLIGAEAHNITKTFKKWLDFRYTSNENVAYNTPDVIVLGMAVHDMLTTNKGSPAAYRGGLIKFRPLLNEIARVSRVIWYTAYSTGDHTFSVWKSSQINRHKTHKYNKLVYQVLGNSSVEIWDSSNLIIEEYLRACSVWRRDDEDLWGVVVGFKCLDFVHAGSVALSFTNQILLNDICHLD